MTRPVGRYLLGVLRAQRGLVLRFVATSLGRTALVMGGVLLIREFLFAVLASRSGLPGMLAERWGIPAALSVIGAMLIGSYAGASLLTYDNQVVRQRLATHVELALLDRLVRHLLTLSVDFFDRSSHGDLIQALRQDVSSVRVIVLSSGTVLMEAVVALGLVGTAVAISPSLAFWALLVLPLAALPLVVIARRTRARSFAERLTVYGVFDAILEMLRGIRVIKVYQAEAAEAAMTVGRAARHFDELIRLVRTRELSTVVLESLAGLGVAAVIIVGGLQVMDGVVAWPQLLAFLVAVRSLYGPLDHVNVHVMEIQRHRAATDRIAALLAERPGVRDAPDARPLGAAPRRIVFEDVGFTYRDTPVLTALSFVVHAGETLGVVGPSGSGKTTLLGLVARFYDPTVGRVAIDGVDLRGVRLDDLYRHLALVTQDPFLFTASVGDNIRCGRPGASDAEVEAAARLAELDEEIRAMPDGYDTVIGAGGRGLSGGQAQRVNIARALLKNAPLLLLDEATSSLDSIAEAKVQRAIDRLMIGRTSFIVAHRLSTLRHADRILVLEAGRIVGLGSHEMLLHGCALYRRLWETQLLGDARRPRDHSAVPAATGGHVLGGSDAANGGETGDQ